MGRTRNIIPDFTKPEIDYIIANANFTERELQLFNLRNMEYSYEICAKEMSLGMTTIKKTAKKTMTKILKVVENMEI